MRNYVIPCRSCELEFDGTEDGPKAYVYFCPLHQNAGPMLIALYAARAYVAAQTEGATCVSKTLLFLDEAIATAEGRSSLLKDHLKLCAFCQTERTCAVAAMLVSDFLKPQNLSPNAPVGPSLVGSPVAPGANLQEGGGRQT
jgi:hypothetical protein